MQEEENNSSTGFDPIGQTSYLFKYDYKKSYSEILIVFLKRLIPAFIFSIIMLIFGDSTNAPEIIVSFLTIVSIFVYLGVFFSFFGFIAVIYKKLFPTKIRILALVEEEKQSDAREAGATYIGLDKYIKLIENNWFNFDVIVTTPSSYKKIIQIADVLSKRGLMPDIKNGNVTNDIFGTISIIKNENWPEGKTEIDSDFLRKLLLNK